MRELNKIFSVKAEPETTPSLSDIIQKEKAEQTVSEYLFTTELRGHCRRIFDSVVNRKGHAPTPLQAIQGCPWNSIAMFEVRCIPARRDSAWGRGLRGGHAG